MINRNGKQFFVMDDKAKKQVMLDETVAQAKANGKAGLIAVATAVIAIQNQRFASQRLAGPLAAVS